MSDVCKMEGKCVQMLLGFGATHTHTSLFSLSLSLSCHTLPPYQLSLSLASHLTRAREMCSILTGANIATAASPLFRFLLCCSVLFCSTLSCSLRLTLCFCRRYLFILFGGPLGREASRFRKSPRRPDV